MISDPFALQKITNKCLCFHCGKIVNIDENYYELQLGKYQQGYLRCLSSEDVLTKKKNQLLSGHGSILRFHIECFEEIAGEEYVFDQKIWK